MTQKTPQASIQTAFQKIYDTHEWLGQSKSGPGSDYARTGKFREFLQNFLKTNDIKRVLDIGCGDWSYSKHMDWTNISYVGIDVVPSVIEANQKLYSSSTVQFLCIDAACEDLPDADLVILKEVLQHLPTKYVETILEKVQQYPYAIFVNDISHDRRGSWRDLYRWKPASSLNTDVPLGGYRLLALREAPFSIDAERVLSYENQHEGLRWTKEVLLSIHPKAGNL